MCYVCNIVSGASLPELTTLLEKESDIYLIYDENVAWVAQEVAKALREMPGQAGNALRGTIGLKTSEEGKTMDTVLALERQLLEAGASRDALLLAVGGGITTDLVGFAASIYKRGIRYANLPTTLLAQVDAAIGGKTGVNLDNYKNMLGAFKMPEFTFLCSEVLKTLPEREFRAGLAEMLKTFLIGDPVAFDLALQVCSYTHSTHHTMEPELIKRAANIKASIVKEDPLEHGIRAKLNLGHTFGHAIEYQARQKGDDLLHGEAVAMGILLAARLSEHIKLAPRGTEARLRASFKAVGLPTECPYPLEDLGAAMEKDKKAAGGKVKWILLQNPGRVVMQEMTVKEVMDDLR